MDYVGDIIETCRTFVGEDDFGETNGIPQSVPLRAFNHAQGFVQGAIYKGVPNFFDAPSNITIVSGTAEYSFPDNLIGNRNLVALRYFPNSYSTQEFWNLVYVPPAALLGGTSDRPSNYTFSGQKSLLIDPTPTSNTAYLQLWAAVALDRVDLRRGEIKELTQDSGEVTEIKLVTASVDADAEILFARNRYLCISDFDGNVVARNIQYTWDAPTKVLTVSYTGTGVAAGQYVTIGKNTTTHSALDNVCSTFIDEYIQRALVASRNGDSLPAHEDIMQREEVKILAVYRRLIRDKKRIPYYGKFD